MPIVLVLIGVSFGTAAIGALGGLGGAVVLVPVLALTGMPTSEAAPLGLLSVAAGSVAAAAPQLRERTVNHRLGVTVELAATVGVTIGALVSGLIGEDLLTRALAVVAVTAALAMLRQQTLTAQDLAGDPSRTVGEWPGQIGGVTAMGAHRIPYRARRLPLGLSLMWVAGMIAGLSGTSGGFLKTPVISNLMGIPVKVAASTTTFTVGVTAAAGLVVFTLQGRIDPRAAAAVVAGSLIGGQVGARMQVHVPAGVIRFVLAGILLVIGGLLWSST